MRTPGIHCTIMYCAEQLISLSGLIYQCIYLVAVRDTDRERDRPRESSCPVYVHIYNKKNSTSNHMLIFSYMEMVRYVIVRKFDHGDIILKKTTNTANIVNIMKLSSTDSIKYCFLSFRSIFHINFLLYFLFATLCFLYYNNN